MSALHLVPVRTAAKPEIGPRLWISFERTFHTSVYFLRYLDFLDIYSWRHTWLTDFRIWKISQRLFTEFAWNFPRESLDTKHHQTKKNDCHNYISVRRSHFPGTILTLSQLEFSRWRVKSSGVSQSSVLVRRYFFNIFAREDLPWRVKSSGVSKSKTAELVASRKTVNTFAATVKQGIVVRKIWKKTKTGNEDLGSENKFFSFYRRKSLFEKTHHSHHWGNATFL